MLAAKNSRKRIEARSPAAATRAGTCDDALSGAGKVIMIYYATAEPILGRGAIIP